MSPLRYVVLSSTIALSLGFATSSAQRSNVKPPSRKAETPKGASSKKLLARPSGIDFTPYSMGDVYNLGEPKAPDAPWKDWLPFVGTVVAGGIAVHLYLSRVAYDEWEKRRSLKIAEFDKKIGVLGEIATKTYELVRLYDEKNRLLKPQADVMAVAYHGSDEVEDVEERLATKGNEPRLTELDGLIASYRNEIASKGYVYGYLPVRVVTNLDLVLGTRIGDHSDSWAQGIENGMRLHWVRSEARALWSRPMKLIVDHCVAYEQEEKETLIEQPYPLWRERFEARLADHRERKRVTKLFKDAGSVARRAIAARLAQENREEEELKANARAGSQKP